MQLSSCKFLENFAGENSWKCDAFLPASAVAVRTYAASDSGGSRAVFVRACYPARLVPGSEKYFRRASGSSGTRKSYRRQGNPSVSTPPLIGRSLFMEILRVRRFREISISIKFTPRVDLSLSVRNP